ncbi:MAG: hypothetical protein ACOVOR_05095 [Rhabdochlamydiaceae bacterium]
MTHYAIQKLENIAEANRNHLIACQAITSKHPVITKIVIFTLLAGTYYLSHKYSRSQLVVINLLSFYGSFISLSSWIHLNKIEKNLTDKLNQLLKTLSDIEHIYNTVMKNEPPSGPQELLPAFIQCYLNKESTLYLTFNNQPIFNQENEAILSYFNHIKTLYIESLYESDVNFFLKLPHLKTIHAWEYHLSEESQKALKNRNIESLKPQNTVRNLCSPKGLLSPLKPADSLDISATNKSFFSPQEPKFLAPHLAPLHFEMRPLRIDFLKEDRSLEDVYHLNFVVLSLSTFITLTGLGLLCYSQNHPMHKLINQTIKIQMIAGFVNLCGIRQSWLTLLQIKSKQKEIKPTAHQLETLSKGTCLSGDYLEASFFFLYQFLKKENVLKVDERIIQDLHLFPLEELVDTKIVDLSQTTIETLPTWIHRLTSLNKLILPSSCSSISSILKTHIHIRNIEIEYAHFKLTTPVSSRSSDSIGSPDSCLNISDRSFG